MIDRFIIHGGGLSDPEYGSVKDRPTFALIQSIRKYFPSSKITLSTWLNETYIDKYSLLVDNIVLSEDPGTTIANRKLGHSSAVNRHIISSKRGLYSIGSDQQIICLIRTDLFFYGNKINKLLTDNQEELITSKKIIALAGGTINEKTKLRLPYLFHVCDFLYLGTAETLKNFFLIPNEYDSLYKNMFFDKNSKPIFKIKKWNHSYIQRWIPESYVVIKNTRNNKLPSSSYEISKKFINNSIETINKKFILIDRSQANLKWLKNNNEWQPGLRGIIGRYSYWLHLYRKKQHFLKSIYLVFHFFKIFKKLTIFYKDYLFKLIYSKLKK